MNENAEEQPNTLGKKIFIPAIGSLGDVQPYLILAKELQKRGYTVWLGVHQRFEVQVRVAGMCTLPSSFSRHWNKQC